MKAAAIETLYAGHLFRSRTEARWAVFFDALGLAWEYEKEGFELPSGRYLPDFYLPDDGTYIEVKGEMPWPEPCDPPGPSHRVFQQMHEFAQVTNHSIYLLVGTPGPWGKAEDRGIWGAVGVPVSDPQGWGLSDGHRWAENRKCEAVSIRHPDDPLTCGCDDKCDPLWETPKILAAYVAARSARFEHDAKWRP